MLLREHPREDVCRHERDAGDDRDVDHLHRPQLIVELAEQDDAWYAQQSRHRSVREWREVYRPGRRGRSGPREGLRFQIVVERIRLKPGVEERRVDQQDGRQHRRREGACARVRSCATPSARMRGMAPALRWKSYDALIESNSHSRRVVCAEAAVVQECLAALPFECRADNTSATRA